MSTVLFMNGGESLLGVFGSNDILHKTTPLHESQMKQMKMWEDYVLLTVHYIYMNKRNELISA